MPPKLENLVVLSPFGVHPARSGGHSAVLEPARRLARAGVKVHLFGLGVRRFEAFRHLRSFVREIEPGLTEERHVSLHNWLDYLRRGRSGLPPLGAGDFLARRASPALKEACVRAQAIQYESPWLFPFSPADRPRVLVAHNDEAALLERAVGASAGKRAQAEEIEGRAWREADLVICFTDEDRASLSERYGEREAVVVPLGVDVERVRPPRREEREAARRGLGVGDRFLVLFTGAWHLPNRSALERVRGWSRELDDRFLLVVAGSVGERPEAAENLRVTGPLPDLSPWFEAADCAVNPVTEGSGANVKLLEYLAAGLPVVTTEFGRRGLDAVDGRHLLVRAPAEFPEALAGLRDDPDLRQTLSEEGRRLVAAERSWEAIGRRRRELLEDLT